MTQTIVGNWKMNGNSAMAKALFGALADQPRKSNLILCPPFPYLPMAQQILSGSGVGWGGQDCHHKEKGAHTGDVSAGMLKDMGCSHVILGHSERRRDHGETSNQVKAKAEQALAEKLIPIICVGETEAERDSGMARTVIESQLMQSLPEKGDCLIAYEPVWAIGTGRTAQAEQIVEMHALIRGCLLQQNQRNSPILYGGSVKGDNAEHILRLPEVDGVLVGGASLQLEEFTAIIAAGR